MGHILLAVLVPATATVDTIAPDLDQAIAPSLAALRIDGYRCREGIRP